MSVITHPDLPFDPERKARALFWMGWKVTAIAEEIGEKRTTVQSWKDRGKWDRTPPHEQAEAVTAMRYNTLVLKENKSGSDYKEIDLLGRQLGRNFGIDITRGARFDVTKLAPMLEDVHERLAGVVIERLPWADFIRRYDRPGTLFYLDPPYFGCEGDYGRDLFSRDQFVEMAEVLADIKGRFILSLNDRPELRSIFAAFDIEEVKVRYTVGGMAKSQVAGEVIISN